MYLFKMGFLLFGRFRSLASNTVVHFHYSTFYLNIIYFEDFVKQIQEKMMQKWLVCQKRGGRRPVLPCFNCISALVCRDTQESIAMGRVLNPRCTPTGPSHSLRARAVAALSACSHSICNDTTALHQRPPRTTISPPTPQHRRSLTCIYLVLSA